MAITGDFPGFWRKWSLTFPGVPKKCPKIDKYFYQYGPKKVYMGVVQAGGGGVVQVAPVLCNMFCTFLLLPKNKRS